ncbi:hypothetical protein KIK06_07925 [Nocardiopsis sp. EMB25]|uniref:hypothetical protein n=1 Tax=Nocardiopsis sp. EMB25 TaxID=2835867 RepID=UPI002284E4A6|nr:hypothetical protein [Nocardiopsis sp. EMB25]MCY9783816.1 hypothetical protein [Nocardiopsis sp. EMB25]
MTNHQETTTDTRFRTEMHRSRDQVFNGTPNDVPAGTHHTHGTVPRAERSH